MLDTTQEAVHSALKRARATVDNHLADSSSTGSSGPAGLHANPTPPPNTGSSPGSPTPWNAPTWTP